jgi:hypothetical protein
MVVATTVSAMTTASPTRSVSGQIADMRADLSTEEVFKVFTGF